jgi:enterochelin esterase-like enzyme
MIAGRALLASVILFTAPRTETTGQGRFDPRAAQIASIPDSAERSRAVDSVIARVKRSGGPMTSDSTLTLLYRGNARRVFVAGDINGWDPHSDEMTKLAGSDLFYRSWTLDPAARFEYKLIADSAWIIDPLNTLRAAGGFGENSEIRMPGYRYPLETVAREGIPGGSIDTVSFASRRLGRRIPVNVYLPAGYSSGTDRYPVLYVTDGGEYMSRAALHVVLDNLIADGGIAPVIAVFIDPRTDPGDPRTNTRMSDYALSDLFVDFLINELRPRLMNEYRMERGPSATAILGASMGGLIATYAAFTHPEVFGLCAAQSPSYQWAHDTLITMIRSGPRKEFRMVLCTGTMHDAETRARTVRDIMRGKGYAITYEEYPESHNWMNWRGRLKGILTAFWGKR